MSTFLGNHDVPRAIHLAEDTPLWSDVWDDGKDRSVEQPAVAADAATNAVPAARARVHAPVHEPRHPADLLRRRDRHARRRRSRQPPLHAVDGLHRGQTALLATVKKLGTLRAAHIGAPARRSHDALVGDDTWVYKMVDGADRVYVAHQSLRCDRDRERPARRRAHRSAHRPGADRPVGVAAARSARVMTP